MIAVRDRRDAWVGPSSRPEYGLRASLGWWSKCNSFNESEMALFSECMLKCDRKLLDTADIVRDGDLLFRTATWRTWVRSGGFR
jgi:hypothetical protein